MLPKKLTGLADLTGSVSGKVTLSGTVAEPEPALALRVRRAAVKVAGIPRIENISGRVESGPKGITLYANAKMGAAPVLLNGNWNPGEGNWIERFESGTFDARILGDEALIVRSGGLRLRGNIDLKAKGTLAKIDVTGTVRLTKSKFVKRLSLVPDLKVKGGATSSEIFGPWEIPGASNFIFDVRIETDERVAVRCNILDSDVDINCRLRGQGTALRLEGICSSQTGTIRMPGMSMRVNSLRFVFSKTDPTRPQVIASASGRRHGIRLDMQVKGPWDDPIVKLSSVPALQPTDLWSLVTTGVQPATLAENKAASNTTILATYVLQELVLSYFASESTEEQESFVSRFKFEFGTEISRNGQETWQVDFDVGEIWKIPKNFGVRFERDVYEDINLGMVYRWRF